MASSAHVVDDLKQSESRVESTAGSSEVEKGEQFRSYARPPGLATVEEDDAVGYKEYQEGLDLELTEKDNRRIRWKIDLVILPIFLITQALQFMDRTALNYANLFQYQQALNLKGLQFNYLSSIVYAGYFFGQYPATILIGRFPAQKVLAISCFFWGVTVLILTQCRSYSSAMALRFIMGLFEACVTPGLTLMTGFWYTRKEIPLRQCIWFSALGWGGIVGSYTAMGISRISPTAPGPEKWQYIFYILGGATMAFSFVIFFILPDSPSTAFFLNKRDRVLAVKRVAGNETGIKNKHLDKKQIWASVKDPKVWILFISVIAAAIPNGVVNSFSTIIIRDLGFSTTKTTQLKSVGDAVQIVALFVAGIITFNVPNSRLLTSTAANTLCVIAAACVAYLPRSNKWGRLVAFWLVNAQSVGYTVSLVSVSSNMGGYTHRAVASALVFTAYCWGNFAGPFVVKPSQAPNYSGASIGLLVGYAIKMGCHIGLLGYLYTVNKRRDAIYGPPDKARSVQAGMEDQTEFENKDFRYVL